MVESVQGYIQHPTVWKGRVAFVAENDLWLIEVDGSSPPRRLTSGACATHPLFCKAGDKIAFSSGADVWVLPLSTCQPTRLTYFGWGEAVPVAWIDSGTLAVASTSVDAFHRARLMRVQLDQPGHVEQLYPSNLDFIVYGVGPDAAGKILGRHTLQDYEWKGYRGGRYGRLWLDRNGDERYEPLVLKDESAPTGVRISVSCPMWVGSRLWFIAEHDGCGNLWSIDVEDPRSLQKHTTHDMFYARWARSDGDSIVYTHAGELWLYKGGEAKHISVQLGMCKALLPRALSAADWCDGVVLHPEGHHVAVVSRGQVFEMALWEGPAVALRLCSDDQHPRKAIRCIVCGYLSSGRLLAITDEHAPQLTFVVYPPACVTSDAQQEPLKACEFLSTLLAETGCASLSMVLSGDSIGNAWELACSPAHDAVVITTNRSELILIEFVTEGGMRLSPQEMPCLNDAIAWQVQGRVLDKSTFEEGISDPCWSPDGEWLSYSRKDSPNGSSLVLLCVSTGEKTIISDSSFENHSPSFDPSGKYIAFISARTFAPMEEDITADYVFSAGAERPYLVLLQSSATNPFQRKPMSPAELAEAEDQGEDDEEEPDSEGGEDDAEDSACEFEPPKLIEVDLDGIQDRILGFPVRIGNYSQGSWTESGKYQYLRGHEKQAVEGADDEEEEPGCDLFMYDFLKQKEKQLADNVTEYEVSMDLQNMLLRRQDEDEEQFSVHVVGEPVGEGGEDDDDDEDIDMESPGPESGIIDVEGRIRLEVIPAAEWQQIFEETCRHVEECFFDPEFGGVDWKATCQAYSQVLARIRSRYELTDLLTEMLAELGVSHISLSDPESDDEESALATGNQGRLGVECAWQDFDDGGGAYRVTRVLRGDTWNPRESGPLARPTVAVTEGSLIIAVNRARVSKDVSIDCMLSNAQGTEVFLTVIPPENATMYEQVQSLVAKSGGVSGLRKVTASQMKGAASRKRGKKGRKNKKEKVKEKEKQSSKQKSSSDKLSADINKALVAMLSKAGMHADELAPIWRTVRLKTADEDVYRSATRRDLVESRSLAVLKSSNDKVGYLHIPDTCEVGYAEFYRYFTRQCQKPALIVDLRCNNGGVAAEAMLRKLRELPLGWSIPREGRGKPSISPAFCRLGKLVVLVDENTCSDGECWASDILRFKLGEVVGCRSWGGVVEVGGATIDLLDGAELQIPASHYYKLGENYAGAGFSLENFGVEPTVEVEWPPTVSDGEDPQLAVAIRLAMNGLEKDASGDVGPSTSVSFPKTRLHRITRRQP